MTSAKLMPVSLASWVGMQGFVIVVEKALIEVQQSCLFAAEAKLERQQLKHAQRVSRPLRGPLRSEDRSTRCRKALDGEARVRRIEPVRE